MFSLVATFTFDPTAPLWKHATCINSLFLSLSTTRNNEQHNETYTETGNNNSKVTIRFFGGDVA
jgi:hypothetical protein